MGETNKQARLVFLGMDEQVDLCFAVSCEGSPQPVPDLGTRESEEAQHVPG